MEGDKLLLVSRLNTLNYGDVAIARSVKLMFQQCGEIFQTDLCIDKEPKRPNLATLTSERSAPKSTGSLKKQYQRLRWCLRRKYVTSAANSDYDCLLIGGGELLQDNVLFPMAIYSWIKAYKRSNPYGRIVLFAVGAESEYGFIGKWLLSRSLRAVDVIYARDNRSVQNIKTVFGLSSVEIPDAVFFLYNDSFFVNARVAAKSDFLFSVTTWDRMKKHNCSYTSTEQYYDEIYQMMAQTSSDWNSLKLFYSAVEDRKSCIEFQRYLEKQYNVSVQLLESLSLDELLDNLTKAKFVCSPRMHGCILGMLVGAEIRPQLISNKMKSFASKYQDPLTNYCFELRRIRDDISFKTDNGQL